MKNTLLIALAAILALASSARADIPELLVAIRTVETGGVASPPDGDGGASVGAFQIHFGFWKDAIDFDPSIGGCYADCRTDPDYSASVVRAYWRRYAAKALASCDYETLARIVNGGPHGAEKRSTLGYWKRVRAAMAAE